VSARHAALLGLLAALWGSSYLLIKYVLDGFSPAEIVFGRAALAAVVLVPLCALRGGATRARLADVRRRPGLALVLGTLFVAAPFLLISFGELHVPSGLTAILIAPSLVTLPVALLAPATDSPDAGDWAALVALGVTHTALAFLIFYELIGAVGAGRATCVLPHAALRARVRRGVPVRAGDGGGARGAGAHPRRGHARLAPAGAGGGQPFSKRRTAARFSPGLTRRPSPPSGSRTPV